MKYVDEYRDAQGVDRLLHAVRSRASQCWTIMEVCGGQTHGLLRYGIDDALSGFVELVHGPGCPVCVTDVAAIDRAIQLAHRPQTLVTTFGDMLRVPGSSHSLASARASGARVRAVYSPLDALALAEKNPNDEVVFFAVGFETTTPATALAIQQAARRNIQNFSLLVAHVRVQPAMESLLQSPSNRVQAFLAAGHVCTVVGYHSYVDFCRRFRVPVVVTGFEPVDLVAGILACVEQLEEGRFEVENRYDRSACSTGNPHAVQLVDEVFESCDRQWRGLGSMALGGLRLRDAWRDYDAELRFVTSQLSIVESCHCRSGEVMSGQIRPPECASFGDDCTPDHPLGAPMVSSEGACAAYFHYHASSQTIRERKPVSGEA